MTKRVLITGINGFIGRNVTKTLLANGYSVIGISRQEECSLQDDRIIYEKADITDYSKINKIMEKYNPWGLIHLAAIVHKKGNDLSADAYEEVNFRASQNLFQQAAECGVLKVVFASTIEVYGELEGKKIISVEEKCVPKTHYARTKKKAEDCLLNYNEFDYAIMRIAPVYGREFNLNINKRIYIWYPFITYYFGKGDYTFNFCSIKNIQQFVLRWLEVGKTGIYNISDSCSYTAKELIGFEKNLNRGKITFWLPKSITYVAIRCLEYIYNVISNKKSIINTTNFNKLFYSVGWDNKEMKLLLENEIYNMENTLDC